MVVISTGDLVKLTGHSVVEDRLTSEGDRTFDFIFFWLGIAQKQTSGIFLLRRTGKEKPLRLAILHLSPAF